MKKQSLNCRWDNTAYRVSHRCCARSCSHGNDDVTTSLLSSASATETDVIRNWERCSRVDTRIDSLHPARLLVIRSAAASQRKPRRHRLRLWFELVRITFQHTQIRMNDTTRHFIDSNGIKTFYTTPATCSIPAMSAFSMPACAYRVCVRYFS